MLLEWRGAKDENFIWSIYPVFLSIDPNKVIEGWKVNIEKAKNNLHKDMADKCLFDTAANYFDSIKIHSMKSDALGVKWKDEVTLISTDRQSRYKNYGFPPP